MELASGSGLPLELSSLRPQIKSQVDEPARATDEVRRAALAEALAEDHAAAMPEILGSPDPFYACTFSKSAPSDKAAMSCGQL